MQPSLEAVLKEQFKELDEAIAQTLAAPSSQVLKLAFAQLKKIVEQKKGALTKNLMGKDKLNTLFEAVEKEFKV